jgi:catechol 2,3-dioxygenase-like lactoylglutathione lyase family enzyme
MRPQPLIAVHDVKKSSRWYQAVLGCESGHGGNEYEQIVCDGEMILQLHHWDAHEHPHMGKPTIKPGNGALLWFQTEKFDAALKRAKTLKAEFLEEPSVNSNANHREFWLRDPDGYVVVIAGVYGDIKVGDLETTKTK